MGRDGFGGQAVMPGQQADDPAHGVRLSARLLKRDRQIAITLNGPCR